MISVHSRTTIHRKMPCTNSHHGYLISLEAMHQCFSPFAFRDTSVPIIFWLLILFPSPAANNCKAHPHWPGDDNKRSNPKQNHEKRMITRLQSLVRIVLQQSIHGLYVSRSSRSQDGNNKDLERCYDVCGMSAILQVAASKMPATCSFLWHTSYDLVTRRRKQG
jgi:hypothetical protein